METLLSQAEQLPGLLAASRSGLVRSWDPATVTRCLSWGRFFQQLHGRLQQAQPELRAALERRLSRAGLPGLGHWRRCPERLALALLENRALPSAARRSLLSGLVFPAPAGEAPFVPLLARRKAAAQLLLARVGPAAGQQSGPVVKAQAQLLLARLREGSPAAVAAALLEQLPEGAALYRAVAAALLEPGAEEEARTALLPWLLRGDGARLAAFCRLLPAARVASLCSRHPPLRGPYLGLLAAWGSRLVYDPLRGEWRSRGPRGGGGDDKEEEVPWQEMAERLCLLAQEPEPLGGAVRAELRRLKAQDGDFEVPGLSLWTDLLLGMENPGGALPRPVTRIAPKHLATEGEKDRWSLCRVEMT